MTITPDNIGDLEFERKRERLLHLDDDQNFQELFRELDEEPPIELSEEYEEWEKEQIEISKMLQK